MLGILVLALKNMGDHGIGRVDWVGAALILLALIPEALQAILLKWLSPSVESSQAANWVTFFAALLCLPVFVFEVHSSDSFQLQLRDFILLLGSGLCSATYFFCWSRGVRGVEASVAGLFGGVLPVGVALLALVFLGEKMTRYEFMGITCVLFSIIIGSLDRQMWLQIKSRVFILPLLKRS